MGRYMKYKFILTTLLSGYTCAAMAQVNPVLVSDEITAGKFDNNKQFLSTFAQYVCGGILLENAYIPMTNDKCAIYVKSSSGVALHSISVEVLKSSGYNGEISIYGKNNAYSGYSDFYNGFEGSLIGKIKFSQSDYKQSISNIPQDYRFWGIAHDTDDSNISRVNVTWKLAYSRENVTSGNLGTICLPYDVEAEQLEDVTVYSVVGKTTIDGQVAIVCEEVESMEAGQPYLFVAEGSSLFLVYSNPESYKSEPMSSGGFCGNFVQTKAGTLRNDGDDDVYVVSNNEIRKAGDDVNIGANRAYFRMNALPDLTEGIPAASSPRFVLSESGFAPFGGEHPTLVETPSALMPASATYDLSGRHVYQMQPGISIRGGKKRLE